MLKIVVIGYGAMYANIIQGCLNSNAKIVGVFYDELLRFSPLMLCFKNIFNPSKDYLFSKSLNLNILKGKSVNSLKFQKQLLKLNPDIIFVGSWSEKFIEATFNIPKIATINVHPSLLPRYRGPNPYLQVILNNEKYTGVTFHIMDKNFDSGPILLQEKIKIEAYDNGKTLKNKTCAIVKNKISYLISQFNDGHYIIPKLQDENEATYQKAINENDVIIDFDKKNSNEIDCQIRAISPFSKVYVCLKNDFFYFENYEILYNSSKKCYKQGEIVKFEKNRTIYIATKDNKILKLTNLKAYGIFGKLKAWLKIRNIF